MLNKKVVKVDYPIESNNKKTELSDVLVAYLEQLGVEYVFGIPGGAIEPLYNALSRSGRRGGPRAVIARHETGAAFMADGYARNTGRLGVCCATTGPGATNLLTGVASAYQNNIPMLVITAQTPLSGIGRGSFQDSSNTGIDTVGMFRFCTHYSALVPHINQFERSLSAALFKAFQQPCGPVHLSLPPDVMNGVAETPTPRYDLRALLATRSTACASDLDQVYAALSGAHNPVIILGPQTKQIVDGVVQLAELINARIVETPHAKGFIDPYHPHYRGILGFCGHSSATEALSDLTVDRVLAIGVPFVETVTAGWNPDEALRDKLIHIDASSDNLSRSPYATHQLQGDVTQIISALLQRFANAGKTPATAHPCATIAFSMQEEEKTRANDSPIKPQRLMRELGRLFPSDTLYVADSGNSFAWSVHYLHIEPNNPSAQPNPKVVRRFRHDSGEVDVGGPQAAPYQSCLEYVCMGWAIGAAIGTALANPGRAVVCLTGDGSYLMNGQEISVALEEQLPVIFVILNDSAYGMVKHGQRMTGAEPIGFELPRVDFVKMADAMGIEGHVITSPEDLLAIDFARISAKNGPTLLDVHIDAQETPPFAARLSMLRSTAHD